MTLVLEGAGIAAASDDTTTGFKVTKFLQQGTIDGLDIEVTDTSNTGWLCNQVYRSSETAYDTFANCALKGTIVIDRTGGDHILSFGDNVDVSELTLKNDNSGTLTIFGKASNDFVAVEKVSSSDGDIIFPFEEEFTIDASAANENVYYRVLLDGNTQSNNATFGSINAGDSLTVTLSSSDYSHLASGNDIVIAVSGADVFAQQITRTSDGTNTSTTITLSNNPNYNTGGVVSTAVAITDDYDYDSDLIVFTIDAGTTLGGSAGNATFGSFKSTQHFVDLISDVGTDADFSYPSTVAYRLNPTYHSIVTQETDSSTSSASLQGLSVTSGDVSGIITEGAFTGSGTVGVILTADTAIDYGSIGAEVETKTADVIIAVNNARDFITDNDDDNFDTAHGG